MTRESTNGPLLWGEKRYHTWNYHLRQTFGEKVFKVSLDGGFTCPNRDGTVAVGGCTFCSARGPEILPEPARRSGETISGSARPDA